VVVEADRVVGARGRRRREGTEEFTWGSTGTRADEVDGGAGAELVVEGHALLIDEEERVAVVKLAAELARTCSI
jgi:hypothetical protein